MANFGVHVVGIPELSRALRDLDKDAYKQFRLAMKEISKQVIKRAEHLGAPGGVLRPRATQKGAGIAFPEGGPDSRDDDSGHYPWLDFGGAPRSGRGVTSSTGPSHAKSTGGFRRRYIPEGRYLYPAIGSSRDYIADAIDDAVNDAASDNGFEVRG